MLGWKLIDNLVNFMDLGYHHLLVVATLRKDVDDALAEIEGVMTTAEEVVKDHKELIAPEDYARFLAKDRGYYMDLAYERERSPSPPNRARRARVAALYEVARRHRREALTMVKRAVSESAGSSPFDEPISATPPETPPMTTEIGTIRYPPGKWPALWPLGSRSMAYLTFTIGLTLFNIFGARARAPIWRAVAAVRLLGGGGS
ncbi:hypothetical protein FS749_008883 [Ceratobasidium sp. UAMH 11750]|nr:hypothetical protein FS749_008883 [Ceratobasidium sp. UAMH 11750]